MKNHLELRLRTRHHLEGGDGCFDNRGIAILCDGIRARYEVNKAHALMHNQ